MIRILRHGATLGNRRLELIALCLAYRVFLDIVYIFWVSPIYGYMGFISETNYVNFILSYIVMLMVLTFIPASQNKISYMILQLHLTVTFIPITTVYAFTNKSTTFFAMMMVCFFTQVVLLNVLPDLKLPKVYAGKILFWIVVLVFSTITVSYMLKTYKINIVALLDLSSVYKIRENNPESANIMKYLITWQYRVINPSVMILALRKRKKSIFLGAIGLQVLIYLMIAHKEVLFSIFLIWVMLWMSKKRYTFIKFFIIFLFTLTILSILLYIVFNFLMPFGAGPVRLLYIPAITKFWHYEFFSINRKLYYSEGLIGKIFGIEYPYSVPSGFLVSDPTNNANTGYIAYAYDNAGFLGMIIISLFFVFILKFVDAIIKNDNKMLAFSFFVYPMIILNDVDLFTLLLTGGFALLLFLLYINKDI